MVNGRMPVPEGDVQELREQVAALRALIERQQERLEEQQERAECQQAEIAALRAERVERVEAESAAPLILPATLHRARAVQREAAGRGSAHRRSTSRRALLKLGGVAAAVAGASVALGSTQEAHAATGGNFILGKINGAGDTTTLFADVGTPSPLLECDNLLNPGTIGLIGNGGPGGIGVVGNSDGSGAKGVQGDTDVGFGVYGHATSAGTGVVGDSGASGTGVSGVGGSNGIGVAGYAPGADGNGVFGSTDAGYGVVGHSTSYIDLAASGTGRLWLTPQSSPGAPTSGSYRGGELIRDSTGELWLCVAFGSPGNWVKAAHAVYGYTGGATTYLSKPIRLLDTRSGATDALTNGGGPYAGGSIHPLTIAGVTFNGVTVPSSCAGAIGNVTVVAGGGGGGYLALVPHGAGFSGTANLAFGAGQIVSNSFNVGLSAGQLDIIIGGNPTDVILDLGAVVA